MNLHDKVKKLEKELVKLDARIDALEGKKSKKK